MGYKYDEIGRLENLINENQETYLEHNPIGEYSYKTVQQGNKQNRSAYKYDLRGNLIEALNRTNRVSFEYNELGLITKETTELSQDDEDIEHTLEHSYDELGNRVKTILPDQREVEYSYNEIGAVEEITIDGKTISTIQRDELNRELSRTQGLLETFKEYAPQGHFLAYAHGIA